MTALKQIGIDVDVYRAIEQERRSFSENENDILRRLVLGGKRRLPGASPIASRANKEAIRARGLWSIEVLGERYPAANMKEAYKQLLLGLDETLPAFIELFAAERARSRRFIARNPADLYRSSPHLADVHAHPLKDGWFFDTNLSMAQVAARIRIAARVAGLNYGRDVKLLENLRWV